MINRIPTPDNCREIGGHFWRAQVPGQPNVCAECGYEGQVFEPGAAELTEQQVRIRALTLAVEWAGHRGLSTNDHPGTILITKVASAFADFIIDGTVVER